MVDFAIALTRAPSDSSPLRIAALRSAGLADDAILACNEVVAYFNYVNRMAEGLGVQLEGEEDR